jgi:hypothetical protein
VPSVKRLLAATAVAVAFLGLVFGLIDDELWTLRNWASAVAIGAVLFAYAFAATRWRHRPERRDPTNR